jgi:hypothetical protein
MNKHIQTKQNHIQNAVGSNRGNNYNNSNNNCPNFSLLKHGLEYRKMYKKCCTITAMVMVIIVQYKILLSTMLLVQPNLD